MENNSLMTNEMIEQIKQVMGQARANVAKVVNNELITAYWNIGRIIVEHEQENNERAAYGKQTLKELSKVLTEEFGKGFSVSNLQFMRRFYQTYQIQQTLSVKLSWSHIYELINNPKPLQVLGTTTKPTTVIDSIVMRARPIVDTAKAPIPAGTALITFKI